MEKAQKCFAEELRNSAQDLALGMKIHLGHKTLTDWRAICIFKKCERFFTLPTLQERSNTPNSPKVFEKRLNELRQDKNWQQMQKTEIQRSPADYNENFGLKKVKPCLR